MEPINQAVSVTGQVKKNTSTWSGMHNVSLHLISSIPVAILIGQKTLNRPDLVNEITDVLVRTSPRKLTKANRLI